MTREVDMVRRKAATMDEAQVREELNRIARGISCAAGAGAVKRYETRRAVFLERLKKLTK